MNEAISTALNDMIHSPVQNYATPGLTSWLVGGDRGKVRLFKADRATRHWITPHSHRFNFTCLVLQGEVENILFRQGHGDAYCIGILRPKGGGLGGYELERSATCTHWQEEVHNYIAGQTYSMRAEEIHSIRFSAGCEVLFLEGPQVLETSKILEPWSNGRIVPTFDIPMWMFERAAVTSTAEQPWSLSR